MIAKSNGGDKIDSVPNEEIHKEGPQKSKSSSYGTKDGQQSANLNNTKPSEDQWQTQRKKNFKGSAQKKQKNQEKGQQVYKPIQAKITGMIPTASITPKNVMLILESKINTPPHRILMLHWKLLGCNMDKFKTPQNLRAKQVHSLGMELAKDQVHSLAHISRSDQNMVTAQQVHNVGLKQVLNRGLAQV
ncbi:hypothetical protein HAX54_027956 [Datura stramonium]|uniref:Uncharacterized protein n=1 Tax=Datura stramonium TaxID=4076 RepID=A0ABS8V5K5_DATST|nr:hypothetical protein [Datura stramonium]